MATLTFTITATQRTFVVATPGTPRRGALYAIDDELVEFIGPGDGVYREVTSGQWQWDGEEGSWNVSRGAVGTEAVTHAQGATITEYVPTAVGAGGGVVNSADAGQIAVSDGTDLTGSADLTWDQEARTLGISGSEAFDDATITSKGLGTDLILIAADGDIGTVGGSIIMVAGANVGGDGGAIDILSGMDTVDGDSGGITIHTGDAADGQSGGITLQVGSSASAVGGSVNIGAGTGQTGSGGSVVIQAGSKVTGGSHGSVQLYSGDGVTSLEMGNAGFYVAGGTVILDGLPAADPEVAGQLYTDGAPAPGVPQALMVSGGPA